MSKAIAAAARKWVGRDFKPGVGEQCMGFVRQVLADAKHPLVEKVTTKAVDGLDTSFYLASSLAGRDLGQLVDKRPDLVEGSIVFFNDTYGDYPPGTITHVGICVGNNQMVHRPTMSRPVELADLSGFWADRFRCGLLTVDAVLPSVAPLPKEPTRWKLFAKPGRMVLTCNKDAIIKAGQEVELDFLTMEMVDR